MNRVGERKMFENRFDGLEFQKIYENIGLKKLNFRFMKQTDRIVSVLRWTNKNKYITKSISNQQREIKGKNKEETCNPVQGQKKNEANEAKKNHY